jgi:hypothetical protein
MAIDKVSEVSELHRLYDIQLQAYRDNLYPSYGERI